MESRGLRRRSSVQSQVRIRLQSLGLQLRRGFVWLCLRLLLLIAPWRFVWASEDLANLRVYFPEMDRKYDGILPLPMCLAKIPTPVPWVLVPLVHLLLFPTDLVLLNRALRGEAKDEQLMYPLLTSSRRLWDDESFRDPSALLRLANAVLGGVYARLNVQSQRLQRLLAVYYCLLSLAYVVLYALAIGLVAAMAFKLVYTFRHLWMLFVLVGLFIFVPLFTVKFLSKCVVKQWAPPQGGEYIRAYHGTTKENAEKIMVEGFKASSTGMLGQGVYISRDVNKVLGYGGKDGFIVEVRVRLGTVCIVDFQGHQMQHAWRLDYDAAWVPAKCGMVGSGLEEACIASPAAVQPVRTWEQKALGVVVVYELVRLQLDALAWLCTCGWRRRKSPAVQPTASGSGQDVEASQIESPSDTPDQLEISGSFTHKTVPPQLAHKIPREG